MYEKIGLKMILPAKIIITSIVVILLALVVMSGSKEGSTNYKMGENIGALGVLGFLVGIFWLIWR